MRTTTHCSRLLALFLGSLLAPASPAGPPATGSKGPPNLLVDASAVMVNAAVRRHEDQTQPVRDYFMETEITGTSRVIADVRAELVPDPCHAAVDIVVAGNAYAHTVGTRKVVVLYNTSRTPFEVRRRVAVDAQGIRSLPLPGSAWSLIHLDKITSRDGYTDTIATYFVEQGFYADIVNISGDSGERALLWLNDGLRKGLSPELTKGSQAITRALAWIGQQGLSLDCLDLSTTAAAVSARLRVATPGVGPPPEAPVLPDGTDLGLRVHEATINQVARATVGGQTLPLDQVRRRVDELIDTLLRDGRPVQEQKQRLRVLDQLLAALKDRPATATLAAKDPVSVVFSGQAFTMTVHAAEVRIGQTRLTDVRLRATYRFENGEEVSLRRQGPVEITLDKSLATLLAPLRPLLEAEFGEILKERFIVKTAVVPTQSPGLRLMPLRITAQDGWLTIAWQVKQP